MSLIDVQNISYTYGEKQILKNVSFRVLKGEHIGLVGANGAGKSTLMNLLSDNLYPDKGKIAYLSGLEIGSLEQQSTLPTSITIKDYLLSAFSYLYKIEEQLNKVAQELESATEHTMEKLLDKLARYQEELDANEYYLIEAKAIDIASGMGLSAIGLDKSIDKLSGGQKTRLRLAKLLLEKPKLLLLDEPTNYLDEEHILWLRDFLKSYPNAFIVISHDTEFLNGVTNIIYHLEFKKLERYVGNYISFLEAYELTKGKTLEEFKKQQKEVEKLQTYIQKNKARASTAKSAKSREKKLAKIDLIERPSEPPKPTFNFKVGTKSHDVVIETNNLSIGYDHPLLPPINIELRKGKKVALIGYNGIGKSTIIKTLLKQLDPLVGSIYMGAKVEVGYFEQEDVSKDNNNVLDTILNSHPYLTQKEARGYLAQCGVKSEHIMRPMKTLSGGEQTKVRLCKLMLRDSNLLVLDEPTNHLDIKAKAALKDALKKYEGTILLVSHEPTFYEDWITNTWDTEEWINKKA